MLHCPGPSIAHTVEGRFSFMYLGTFYIPSTHFIVLSLLSIFYVFIPFQSVLITGFYLDDGVSSLAQLFLVVLAYFPLLLAEEQGEVLKYARV